MQTQARFENVPAKPYASPYIDFGWRRIADAFFAFFLLFIATYFPVYLLSSHMFSQIVHKTRTISHHADAHSLTRSHTPGRSMQNAK